jgi:hypothetical protein
MAVNNIASGLVSNRRRYFESLRNRKSNNMKKMNMTMKKTMVNIPLMKKEQEEIEVNPIYDPNAARFANQSLYGPRELGGRRKNKSKKSKKSKKTRRSRK